MFTHDFDAGVPFLSARIGCRLSEFLRHHPIETLNNLLPCTPLSKESNHQGPLLALFGAQSAKDTTLKLDFLPYLRAIQGTLKPSIVVLTVNMRSKGKLTTLDGSIGNVFWLASALSNPAKTGTELSTLVELMSQSIAVIDDEYMRSVQGEQGFEAIAEHLNQLELLFSFEKPDIFVFTSWLNTDFYKLDFGWGQPCSWAILGKAGHFGNLTLLVETKYGKGIEAWITLDETRMSALQKDNEFLNFASPNLQISSL
ncbi:hypothetical protein J1N35_039716 [Gossypium stocksii]|uniref:Uncharacterized protein n=1 Tax=Gossypium stocksii TaxID=47602 RepID=A0A9D3UCR5_9ROSI|nr:hypothetical protein J1N35_039716 [Gossypium stocksii]